MSHVCIHIGPSKTGTTTLQREIFAKHSQISYLGKPFYLPGRPAGDKKSDESRLNEELVYTLRSKDSLEYEEGPVVDGIRTHLEKYPSGNRVSVLSEEGLAASGRADRRLIAERLFRAFGDCDILITMRSQMTCIPSIFLHYYRRGDFVGLNFDDWLRDDTKGRQRARVFESWRQYDYYRLFRAYREVFPDSRVKLMLFEQMSKHPDAFADDLSAFLHIEAAETRSLFGNARRLNTGVSKEEADFHRRYQAMRGRFDRVTQRYLGGRDLEKLMPFAGHLRAAAKRAVKGHFVRKSAESGGAVDASEESLSIIRKHFRESNRRLADECELPLEEYGYPM